MIFSFRLISKMLTLNTHQNMARSNTSSINSLSGLIGNSVVYEIFGKMVVRSRPRPSKVPDSDKRKLNQDKFRQTQLLMHSMLPFIRIGFWGYTENRTAFQEAMSVNLGQDIFQRGGPGTDYSQCILSKGELPGTGQVQAQWEGPDTIGVSWSGSCGSPGTPNDQVMLLFHFPTHNESVIQLEAGVRKDGSVSIAIPAHLVDENPEAYIALLNPGLMAMGKRKQGLSTSQYIGKVVK